MKTITQLKAEVKSLMDASAKIDAQCVTENRGLKPEEKTLKTEIMDSVDDLNSEILVREREEKLQAFLAKPAEPMTQPGLVMATPGIIIGDNRASKDLL